MKRDLILLIALFTFSFHNDLVAQIPDSIPYNSQVRVGIIYGYDVSGTYLGIRNDSLYVHVYKQGLINVKDKGVKAFAMDNVKFINHLVAQAPDSIPYNSQVRVGIIYGYDVNGKYLGIENDSLYVHVFKEGLIDVYDKGVKAYSMDNVKFIQPEGYSKLRVDRPRSDIPSSQYYYLIPNAFNLRKGTFAYRTEWLVVHQLNYGITDRLSIGGGLDALAPVIGILFQNLIPPNVFITSKYTLPELLDSEHINFAVGGFFLGTNNLLYFDDFGDGFTGAAVVYGVSTIGDRDKNLSLGLGWGYAENRLAARPAVMLGGSLRVSRGISVVGELWTFPQFEASVGTLGAKFFGERGSFQIAVPLGTINGGTEVIPFPFLSYYSYLN